MSVETLTLIGAFLGIVAAVLAIISNLFGIGTSLKTLLSPSLPGNIPQPEQPASPITDATVVLAGSAAVMTAVGVVEAAERLRKNAQGLPSTGVDITDVSDTPSSGLSLDDLSDLT